MNFDRRKFLRCSIQTALGGVALSSAFGNLKAIAAAVASAPQLSPTLGRCWGRSRRRSFRPTRTRVGIWGLWFECGLW